MDAILSEVLWTWSLSTWFGIGVMLEIATTFISPKKREKWKYMPIPTFISSIFRVAFWLVVAFYLAKQKKDIGNMQSG